MLFSDKQPCGTTTTISHLLPAAYGPEEYTMDVTATLSLGDPLEPARKATAEMLQTRERTYSLPQPFYTDERLFQIDMQEIFHKEWLIAGMTCEIPAKGNYITLQIGKNPIIVIRGAEGKVHAFHNVCRHRGSRLCVSDKGKVAKLVCHYHQWTYELDGRLLFAGTEMGADFDMNQYGLKPVNVKVAGGYIFISLAENPPAIDEFLATLEHYMEPYDMENTKVAVQTTLMEKANWKLVLENNRECYHCSGSHPELLQTLLEWDDTNDPFQQGIQGPRGRLRRCLGSREDPLPAQEPRPA